MPALPSVNASLAIVRMPGSPERYSVSLGGGTYEVSAAGTCTCKGFFYRGDCKHVHALRDHLVEQRACPACHGNGFLRMRESYADNRTALPCAACGGSGQREPAESMSDAELRKLFG